MSSPFTAADTLVSATFASIAARNAAYDLCGHPDNWEIEPEKPEVVYTSISVASNARRQLAALIDDSLSIANRAITIQEGGFNMWIRVGKLRGKKGKR